MNPILAKNFDAAEAINPYRIVTFGAGDSLVVQASSETDALIGVSDGLGGASGERVDILLSGIAEVESGGSISRGDLLTADASGKGVSAAPGAGVNNRYVGTALADGVPGDIIPVLLSPGLMQG